jgi:effector-binding domain-containing protein
MSDVEPAVVTVEPVTTAVIRRVVAMDRIGEFFDSAFRSIAATATGQDAAIAGPAFALYHSMPTHEVDLEVGFRTLRAVRVDGDVTAGSLPGGRVARAVHAGGYDGLGAAWQQLGAWIGEQGGAPGAVFWEVYVTEPNPQMDPADLRTELNWLLADR